MNQKQATKKLEDILGISALTSFGFGKGIGGNMEGWEYNVGVQRGEGCFSFCRMLSFQYAEGHTVFM